MSLNNEYTVNWNSHSSHLTRAFGSLLSENEFVDVTISCEGKKISAHKMLLSVCSPYFHDLFRDNPCQHPIVILKDVKFKSLENMLKFMYLGEVTVAAEDFHDFYKTVTDFRINGLPAEDTCTNEMQNNTDISTEEQQRTIKTERQKENETIQKRRTDFEDSTHTVQKKLREEIIHVAGIQEVNLVCDDRNLLLEGNLLELENQLQPVDDQPPQLELQEYTVRSLRQKTSKEKSTSPALVKNEHTLEKFRSRGRCVLCYKTLRTAYNVRHAERKATRTWLKCKQCNKFYCIDCFSVHHNSLL
ncbi:hypothetical protein FQA39_LY14539 [Lamprigera yunnana]|nr:hypothetical protein FQA39_LY14539 [Lamprigera yunnana]